MEGVKTHTSQPNGEEDATLTASLSNLSMRTSDSEPPDRPDVSQPRPETPSTQQQHNTDPQRSQRLFADSIAAAKEETYLFNPLDYEDENERQLRLDEFLKNKAPSKVKRSDGVGKIIAYSPSYKDEGLGDVDKIVEEFNKLSREEVNWPAVKKIALAHGCLSGMWLTFSNTEEQIDEAWEEIARATVEDKLGTHAKVTPTEDQGSEGGDLHSQQRAISVYAKNFNKKNEVYDLEKKLRNLGIKSRMAFKPRVYSKIGVYSENEWGLRPGIYTSHWYPVENESVIRDNEK